MRKSVQRGHWCMGLLYIVASLILVCSQWSFPKRRLLLPMTCGQSHSAIIMISQWSGTIHQSKQRPDHFWQSAVYIYTYIGMLSVQPNQPGPEVYRQPGTPVIIKSIDCQPWDRKPVGLPHLTNYTHRMFSERGGTNIQDVPSSCNSGSPSLQLCNNLFIVPLE